MSIFMQQFFLHAEILHYTLFLSNRISSTDVPVFSLEQLKIQQHAVIYFLKKEFQTFSSTSGFQIHPDYRMLGAWYGFEPTSAGTGRRI
jgi:hypothetical protein